MVLTDLNISQPPRGPDVTFTYNLHIKKTPSKEKHNYFSYIETDLIGDRQFIDRRCFKDQHHGLSVLDDKRNKVTREHALR